MVSKRQNLHQTVFRNECTGFTKILCVLPQIYKRASSGKMIFSQNRHHCLAARWSIQRKQNEVDGRVASTLEPIEIRKASYHDLFAKFYVNLFRKYSILQNVNVDGFSGIIAVTLGCTYCTKTKDVLAFTLI